jgi:MoxR-like ATPase
VSEQRVLFESVDAVMDALREHGYIADLRLATMVFLVTRLDKPLLVEGPAGVGKTELAKALALISGRRLLRLQCYEGQDETKALYEWDYGKQLLYTQILREKIGQVVADAPDLESAVDRIGAQESVFFSERFLAARPLLESIRSPDPTVLLIDEVDRADEALEAVLLETLAEFQVSVPEVGTFTTEMSWRSSAARTRGWPTRWPSSWSTSSAGCVSWSSASRPRSPRPSTGHARWRCSASRS